MGVALVATEVVVPLVAVQTVVAVATAIVVIAVATIEAVIPARAAMRVVAARARAVLGHAHAWCGAVFVAGLVLPALVAWLRRSRAALGLVARRVVAALCLDAGRCDAHHEG